MALGNTISDKDLSNKVTQKLTFNGTGACHVLVAASNGDVTLTGSIAIERERGVVVSTAGSVPGVRRVIDNLRVKPSATSDD